MSSTAGTPVVLKKKIHKATVVGMIYLTSGKRKAFLDYVSYFAARAFYSLRGLVKLAVHSQWKAERLGGMKTAAAKTEAA